MQGPSAVAPCPPLQSGGNGVEGRGGCWTGGGPVPISRVSFLKQFKMPWGKMDLRAEHNLYSV